jgi:hypothetical protein
MFSKPCGGFTMAYAQEDHVGRLEVMRKDDRCINLIRMSVGDVLAGMRCTDGRDVLFPYVRMISKQPEEFTSGIACGTDDGNTNHDCTDRCSIVVIDAIVANPFASSPLNAVFISPYVATFDTIISWGDVIP